MNIVMGPKKGPKINYSDQSVSRLLHPCPINIVPWEGESKYSGNIFESHFSMIVNILPSNFALQRGSLSISAVKAANSFSDDSS